MLLSICIPTYNRANYLKKCLDSIVAEFDENNFQEVDIFILDNLSEDNTDSVVSGFLRDFTNITYIKDDQKRGIAAGIQKVSSYGDGRYIWVFSDDDLLEKGMLSKILQRLKKDDSDLYILNLASFISDNRIYRINLLDIDQNYLFSNRKELFKFLESKFLFTIDYYTTFCTNWILKKDYLVRNLSIFNKYNSEFDLFPFQSVVFYSDDKLTTSIILDQVVLFRADNASWVKKDSIQNLFYKNRLWNHHYNFILKCNSENIFWPYYCKHYLKKIIQSTNIILLLFIMFSKKIGIFNLLKKIKNKIL